MATKTRNARRAAPKNLPKTMEVRTRNWAAVAAHLRSGAGGHQNKKHEGNRRACRGRVDHSE